jgi:sugar phosphate isomerase/epimerase
MDCIIMGSQPYYPMMLHTFSTLGCPELDLDGAIALAARHGLHSLELRTLNSTTDLPAWFATHYGTPAGLAAHLKQRHVKVCAMGTSFKLVGHDDIDRLMLEHYVKWADEANVPWLRVFDGGRTGDSDEIAEAAETLAWWRAHRIKNNWAVDLMVETHDSLLDSERLHKFINKVPQVSILWDVHHTWKKGGEGPAHTWKAIRNHVVHLHVKDSVSKPSARHPYTYVLPGTGEMPAREVLRILQDNAFTGAVALEWEKMWHPYLPDLAEALAACRDQGWW